MLNYSFSTVLMTVLTSNILIIVISLCFRSKKALFTMGYKLLSVVLVFALLRLIFPFELPFSRNILMPEFLSRIVHSVRHPFATLGRLKITIWLLFECIWICGTVYKLFQIIRSHVIFNGFVRRYGKDVTERDVYAAVLRKICDSRKASFRVLLVPGLDTPRQNGCFHPCILIPEEMELSEEDIYYTICHEMAHYKHRDFLIKLAVNILTALYWWNPLCYALRNHIDMILEMRVDEKLVNGDQYVRNAYLSALINIGSNVVSNYNKRPNLLSRLSSPTATGGVEDLSIRIHMLYREKKLPLPLFFMLVLLMLMLHIGSYRFIFEGHYIPQESGIPEIQSEDMYAVPLNDGTYDIYLEDIFIEHTDSLKYYTSITIIYNQ